MSTTRENQSDTISVWVWGQSTALAGHRANPDLSDEDENMDDYTEYAGTAEELLSLADVLDAEGGEYNHRVAKLLREDAF